jgi:hypothetical protein
MLALIAISFLLSLPFLFAIVWVALICGLLALWIQPMRDSDQA